MSNHERLDFKEIARAALAQAEVLVPRWLPNGRRHGHEWRCGDIQGSAGTSFSVNLTTGVWADFASDDCKGADLIALYAAIFTADDQGLAAREMTKSLGMVSGVAVAQSQVAPAASTKPKKTPWEPVLPVPDGAPAPPVAHPVRGRADASWRYLDPDGRLLGVIYRFRTSDGGKELLPCVWARHPDDQRSEWRWLSMPTPRPLYGIHQWAGKGCVLVVEGEKCVDVAYRALGEWFDVVSWPGGGKAVGKADWSVLAGRKVIIWPDCDSKRDKKTLQLLPEQASPGQQGQPGIKAAEDIAKLLLSLGCSVRLVKVPAPGTVIDGWDVADAIGEGQTGEELRIWIYKNLRESIHATQVAPAQADVGSKAAESADSVVYWKSELIRRPRGGYEDCKENVALALEKHPGLQGLVGYNEFSARMEKLRPPPWQSGSGEWTEEDDLELSMWLGVQAGLLFKSTATIGEGVRLVSHRNKFHPVRAWLDSLEWDGMDRLSIWLRDCLGVKDSPYASLIGALWLRQAVNRILHPGSKGDYVLILEGNQGLMKSSALRVLGGEWFSDAALDLSNKDAYQTINGIWIYEIAELDAFNRSEATRIKAFLTQSEDRYRPPYGRRIITQLRQTVFAATTNNFEYHKDPTGNRRFWSVLCTKVDINLIKEIREQLFAQAVHEVRQGLPIYPTRDQENTMIVPEQQMREIVDPWHETIALWLDEPVQSMKKRFTSAQILTGAIKMELAKIDGQRSSTTRVGTIMMSLGWIKGRDSSGLRLYYYERPERTSGSASR